MARQFDMVKFNVSGTPGTGTVTVGTRYDTSFALPIEQGAIDGDRVFYRIQKTNKDSEVGIGTIADGVNEIERTIVLSSMIDGVDSTSKINIDGTAFMAFITASAAAQQITRQRTVTDSTDTIVDGDGGGVVTYNRATAVAVTIGEAEDGINFLKDWFVHVRNVNSGTVTITPTTSTIAGASSAVLLEGDSALIWSDGTNYQAIYARAGAVRFDRAQSLTAAQKAVAIKNVAPSVLAKSSNYTAVADDNDALIVLTNSATLSLTAAATLGNGWRCFVNNASTGIWTIDPNSSEAINGATTIRIYPGEAFEIRCNGSAFYTVGRATGKVLLKSFTASSSASIVFDSSVITDEFDLYTVEYNNVVPATNSVGLYLTVSQDNGSSYKSANYAWQRAGAIASTPNAGTFSGNASASEIRIVDNLLDNGTPNGANGTLDFWSPAVVGVYHAFRSLTTFNTSISSLGLCQWRVDGIYLGDGFAINNIKFAMSSGNIAQGKFRLYGHRQ